MSPRRESTPEDAPGLVMCTCPDATSADGIASRLVEERLAASVNVVPGVRSTYRWQDRVHRAEEHLLLIKTMASRFGSVERVIVADHPYELPQVVCVTIDDGLNGYLHWIRQSVMGE